MTRKETYRGYTIEQVSGADAVYITLDGKTVGRVMNFDQAYNLIDEKKQKDARTKHERR